MNGSVKMLEGYNFKTEFHAHTNPASSCSDFTPEEVVKRYADIGYDSIVICNHFHSGMRNFGEKETALKLYFDDIKKAVEAGEKYGINVITGCEIRFTENSNDYLLFGVDEEVITKAYDYIEKGLEEFSKWFRSEDRLLIQAHPFRNGMEGVDPELLDGIESFNMHPGHNSRVAFSAKHAAEHNFLVTAGTDFHHENHQGMVAVLSKKELKTSADIVKLLKSRDYLFKIGNSIVLPYGLL